MLIEAKENTKLKNWLAKKYLLLFAKVMMITKLHLNSKATRNKFTHKENSEFSSSKVEIILIR